MDFFHRFRKFASKYKYMDYRRSSNPSEAIAYSGMKTRCYNPNDEFYENYGGRGIRVCEEWLIKDPRGQGFRNFLDHIGKRPGPGYSIDRIDVNGNYEPGNVRWATIDQQANNRTSNHNITYQGKTQNITAWAKELGISRQLLSARIHQLKLPFEKAILKDKALAGCSGNHTKLTKEQVVDIYQSKEEYCILVERYNIAISAISRIKNKVRYKEETLGLGEPGRSSNINNPRRKNKS